MRDAHDRAEELVSIIIKKNIKKTELYEGLDFTIRRRHVCAIDNVNVSAPQTRNERELLQQALVCDDRLAPPHDLLQIIQGRNLRNRARGQRYGDAFLVVCPASAFSWGLRERGRQYGCGRGRGRFRPACRRLR